MSKVHIFTQICKSYFRVAPFLLDKIKQDDQDSLISLTCAQTSSLRQMVLGLVGFSSEEILTILSKNTSSIH